jgi:hypothetical protein
MTGGVHRDGEVRYEWEDDDDDDDPSAASPNGAAGAAQGSAAAGATTAPALPVIEVYGGSLARNRYQAEAALALRGMHEPLGAVYQRGGLLVRVHRLLEAGKDRYGVKRAKGSPTIVPVDGGFLHCHLAEAAHWFKVQGKKTANINPPPVILGPLLAGPWETIRPLSGLLETPALLPDGRLLTGSGYDDETGLLLDTIQIPPIVRSRRAGEAALKTLMEIYADFPFETEVDRATALSLSLSGIEAALLPATPLAMIDAPEAGSGKTLLTEVTGLLATGRFPAAMPQAADEAEDKKRLLSILLAGDPIGLIDNIARPLESDALCMVITGGEYEDRVLGASRKVRLRCRMLWLVTGNNARAVGDLIRRTIRCRIDPRCERPDERLFDVNLHREVPRRRPELVHAALTIMASYIAAGRPKPLRPYGNFEDWSRMVREALVWLGAADPCDSREVLASSDPEREALALLMDAWHACFADEPKLIKEVLTKADEHSMETMALRDAIANAAVARGGNATLGQSLGFYLRSKMNRVHGGRFFTKAKSDTHANATAWQLAQR